MIDGRDRTGRGEGRRRRALPWVLLAMSAALNLAFVGGYFVARSMERHARSPEGRMEMLAERLDLDEAQRGQMARMREAAAAERQARSADLGEVRHRLWDALRAGEADPARIEPLAREMADRGHAMHVDAILALARFSALLRPEQREGFIEMMERRAQRRGGLVGPP